MAYDYENYKKFYNAMNDTQRAKWAESNKNDADFNDFMSRYNSDSNATKSYVTPKQSNYQSQGEGNYVYNEKTGYYENQTNTSKNTVNQGIAPQPETKQEVIKQTPTKQQETVINTDTKNYQQGALTPASKEYYSQTSDEALNKIRDNLNNYRQTNPEYFSDYDSFKKNFSYDLRNDEQKNVLDTWYTGYSKGLELSATPITDLYTQYQNGQISINDLENLRISNPTKYAELMTQINKGNIISAYDDDKGTTFTNFQDLAYQLMGQAINSLTKSDSGASQYFSDYEEKMNSPEMLDLQDKTTDLQEQIENIQDQIATMIKDVENEYEGTGASKSKINAIIADRTYDLQLQLRSLNSEYNKYATQYNNRATQYQNEFNLQLQEYQLNMQARNQRMNELGFAMDLMNFETNEQKAQREWDYWVKQQEYTNGNINSSDYQTRYKAALKSVQNLLSKYEGIPMIRSAEEMTDDILKAIDNGSNLGAELTKLNKQIQGKDEYKQLYNATFGNSSKGIEGTYNIGGTEYVVYNGKLMTSSEFNNKYGGTKGANYTIVSDDKIKTYSDGRAGTFGSFMANPKNDDKNYIGECGKFVNNYLQEIGAGRPFGNEDIKTREKWINSDEGKIGTVAVFDYGHYSSDGINHGHVGIVVSAPDKNGDFWVKDANFDSDGKIQTRKVNIKDASLKGFIDPTLNSDGTKGTVGTTVASTSNNSNTIVAGGLTTTGIEQEAKNMIDGKKNYSEIKAAYGDEALKQIELKMLDLVNQGYTPDTKITDPTRLQTAENNALKQYESMTSDAKQVLDFVDQMETAWSLIDTDKSAAEQLLITTYNKITDPKSIVRESEFNRTAEGQSLMNELWGKLSKLSSGGAGITKSELSKYINVARELGKNAEAKLEKEANRMKVVIDKYGYSPEYVLGYDMADKLYKYPETDGWDSAAPKQSTTTVGTFKLISGWTVPNDWTTFK